MRTAESDLPLGGQHFQGKPEEKLTKISSSMLRRWLTGEGDLPLAGQHFLGTPKEKLAKISANMFLRQLMAEVDVPVGKPTFPRNTSGKGTKSQRQHAADVAGGRGRLATATTTLPENS